MNELKPEALMRIAAECPGYQARLTARTLTRYYNACFKPLDLTAEQFSLLLGIAATEGGTLVELADQAGVDPTTLSRNVRVLEGRGLVDAEGGRGRAGKKLALTAAGRQLLSDALPIWGEAKARLVERMGGERLSAATRAMGDLAGLVEVVWV